jgi:hypothetical protein
MESEKELAGRIRRTLDPHGMESGDDVFFKMGAQASRKVGHFSGLGDPAAIDPVEDLPGAVGRFAPPGELRDERVFGESGEGSGGHGEI